MAEHAVRLPDVGEGVAEAELVEWHVKIGELVREDEILAAVMTDKATVEIPSPIAGEIVWLAAEVGDVVAVGSDLVRVKIAGEGNRPAIERAPPPNRGTQAVAADQAAASLRPAAREPVESDAAAARPTGADRQPPTAKPAFRQRRRPSPPGR